MKRLSFLLVVFILVQYRKTSVSPKYQWDNYVPQWWVELDNELSWLFTNRLSAKMFKFLNQCFARLPFWKSVSSKTAVAPSSRFRESETLFQNRSRAKHWLKNLNILGGIGLTDVIENSERQHQKILIWYSGNYSGKYLK